ncbi:MAG: hypothetical protein QM743_08330 [Chitinophagaceae bacterium]
MNKGISVIFLIMLIVFCANDAVAQTLTGTYTHVQTPSGLSENRCTYGSLETSIREEVLILSADSSFQLALRTIVYNHRDHTKKILYSGMPAEGHWHLSARDTLELEGNNNYVFATFRIIDSSRMQIEETAFFNWEHAVFTKERKK